MKTFKQYILETEQEHHASVIPLTGFSPHSHMGHAIDLGNALKNLPGQKHIGISSKADVFSPEERSDILHRQWQQPDLHVHVAKYAGESISNAYNSLPEGKKHLHILVGADRRDFAEGLKKSLEDGKIQSMGGHKWDSISVHTPEDTDRSHGMSGTKMRTAVANDDFDTYHEHLGKHIFSEKEARSHFNRIKEALTTKQIKVKR